MYIVSLPELKSVSSGRYLTSNGIERQPRLLKDVKDRSSKPKQKGSTSALQPEIVEAALMHEAQEEAIQSLESKRADDVPVHTPQVVSAFSEASQSQVSHASSTLLELKNGADEKHQCLLPCKE